MKKDQKSTFLVKTLSVFFWRGVIFLQIYFQENLVITFKTLTNQRNGPQHNFKTKFQRKYSIYCKKFKIVLKIP